MKIRSFLAIIGISLFTIGCPQSKETLDAFTELRSIGKIVVRDTENQAFADTVSERMIAYLDLRHVSGINQGLGVSSDKTSTLDCFITHHSKDTAEMLCSLKHDGDPLVKAMVSRGVGMNEYGHGIYDRTAAHILSRRVVDELHLTLQRKFVAKRQNSDTKRTPH